MSGKLSEQAQESLKSVGNDIRSEWQHLVDLALSVDKTLIDPVARGLASASKIGPDSIRRKLESIQYAQSLGHPPEDIKAFGQERVLGEYIKSKRVKTYSDSTVMKWSVPGSLRELVQQDVRRIMDVLGLYTSEEFFDWLHAQLVDLTDDQIRQSAGEDR